MTANPVGTTRQRPADLLAMADDGHRYELINGEIVAMGTASRAHTVLGTWLLVQLGIFIAVQQLGGQLGGADGTYQLDEENVRVPDISYLSPTSAARLSPGTVFCPFAPDFAVEIKSPSNSEKSMRQLARLYLQSGSRLVWTIDFENQVVKVYRPGQLPLELDENDTLEGGDIFPGFRLPVVTLFAQITGV